MKIYLLILAMLIYVTGCKNNSTSSENKLTPTTPVVKISSLSNNAVVLESATIEIEATDDKGITKVEIYIDNKTDSSKTLFIMPYKYIWQTPQIEDSSKHLLYAKAYDADGNVSTTDVWTINVYKFRAPTNFQINSMSESQIAISWVDNSLFETGYEIEQSSNNGNFSLIKTVGPNVTSTTILSSFEPSINYSFRTRAVTANNKSPYSNISSYNIAASTTIMVLVSGGTFVMGSENSIDKGASPSQSITLSDFYISSTEIRWGTWDSVYQWAKNNGYSDLPIGRKGYTAGDEKHPVTEVNWYDVLKWCNAKSEKEGLTPVYYINTSFTTPNIYKTGQSDLQNTMVNWNANGYRLPTEAEWEFAARGGNKSKNYVYSGNDTLNKVGWYDNNSNNNTHQGGTKSMNELGLYDMSGNAWEWCWDWWGSYSGSPQTNPHGVTSGTHRILRGGSFLNTQTLSRVFGRELDAPNIRYMNEGFRVSRTK